MRAILLPLIFALTPHSAFAMQPCPDAFQQIPLLTGANSCHIFDDSLPASLSYYINQTPQQVLDHYLQTLENVQFRQQPGQRFVLIFQQNKQRLIISPDGPGSQVDILVQQ